METYKQALNICLRLKEEGYIAYFAGGWVRDWLLGHPSTDIDIATNAPLSVLLDLFPRTILVGMAFGVLIVQMEGHAFELAIFRKDISYTNGRKPDRIEPSSPEEDAKRRDFTINGLFYDPLEDKLWDYVGGQEDLKKGVIRAIGDPWERFAEDRLRMIRAVRFSARFGFHIDPDTEEAIRLNAPTLLPAVASERIYQEFAKMSEAPRFSFALVDLFRLGLLGEIFPSLKSGHLKEIKAKATEIPENLPLIVKLRELVKDPRELIALKLSAKEQEMIEYLDKVQEDLLQKRYQTSADWARFYAHPWSTIALQLYGEGENHQFRQDHLAKHIERLRSKKPLVQASHLLAKGITPGIEMGRLLKQAEEIAINRDLEDAATVLKELHL